MHAVDIEQKMLNRGLFFDVIDWTERQVTLPFEPSSVPDFDADR